MTYIHDFPKNRAHAHGAIFFRSMLLLIYISLCFGAKAQSLHETTTDTYMRILLNDSTVIEVGKADIFQLNYFRQGDAVVNTSDGLLMLSQDEIAGWEYTATPPSPVNEDDVNTGARSIATDDGVWYEFTDTQLVINGLVANETVMVYTLQGIAKETFNPVDGQAIITFRHLGSGGYVATWRNASLRFIVK